MMVHIMYNVKILKYYIYFICNNLKSNYTIILLKYITIVVIITNIIVKLYYNCNNCIIKFLNEVKKHIFIYLAKRY